MTEKEQTALAEYEAALTEYSDANRALHEAPSEPGLSAVIPFTPWPVVEVALNAARATRRHAALSNRVSEARKRVNDAWRALVEAVRE
jgi:hypothetical protein